MKTFLLLLSLAGAFGLQAQILNTSTPQGSFDPEHDPIAIRVDSSFQLLVSEYMLIKSLQARLSTEYQIYKVHKTGETLQPLLVFEGVYLNSNQQNCSISISLIAASDGLLYHTSNQALVCSTPGCSNCSILEGNCVGCCANSNTRPTIITAPLAKVLSNIDK